MSENQSPQVNNEELSTGLKVLSFCVPLAGIVLYFMKKDEAPTAAKTAIKFAAISIGLAIVLNIIAVVAGLMQ